MKAKTLIGLAAAAALLSGCATYAYDDPYVYNDRPVYYERPAYGYYDYPAYYPRYYAGPSVGFGLSFGRHWHHRR